MYATRFASLLSYAAWRMMTLWQRAVGNETGETIHVEHVNSTLRQRRELADCRHGALLLHIRTGQSDQDRRINAFNDHEPDQHWHFRCPRGSDRLWNVGQGIALTVRRMGAIVYVVERNPRRKAAAYFDGMIVSSLRDLVRSSELIITSTGHPGTIIQDMFSRLRKSTYLANVGCFRSELPLAELEREATAIAEVCPGMTAYHLPEAKAVLTRQQCYTSLPAARVEQAIRVQRRLKELDAPVNLPLTNRHGRTISEVRAHAITCERFVAGQLGLAYAWDAPSLIWCNIVGLAYRRRSVGARSF